MTLSIQGKFKRIDSYNASIRSLPAALAEVFVPQRAADFPPADLAVTAWACAEMVMIEPDVSARDRSGGAQRREFCVSEN